MKASNNTIKALSLGGVVISLGIAFGDIGTSPLYVMKAFIDWSSVVSTDYTIGFLSCVIWTLTIQTTLKYIIITLKADNHGEGGIFSLFALLRKKREWLFIFAIIGGSTMLADGIITPSITVLSAVEGLGYISDHIPVLPITLIIITVLFFIQQFGTSFLGKSFGPIMLLWFSTIGILGFIYMVKNPVVLYAFNPVYAYNLLMHHPEGFLLLGAVFLCTTGAEALYADLGHCGLWNIRVSWIFVKTMLILNYLGQGAWIISHLGMAQGHNPFYSIMPVWFLPFGVVLATLAAIIASQALISGSYTLISEAISLNFWPRVKIKYPSQMKGQIYVPVICGGLFVCCVLVILHFKTSAALEAAYGLAITITMLATSMLILSYLRMKNRPLVLIVLFGVIYFTIEGAFLLSNLHKFSHGGWFTVAVGAVLSLIMVSMYYGRKVRNRFISFLKIKKYLPVLADMIDDETIPTLTQNLVYTTHADRLTDIEAKSIDSIIMRNPPKRAGHYWFLHVDIVDSPHMLEYQVTDLIKGKVTRIDFYLGFKVPPRINDYFMKVLNVMAEEGTFDPLCSNPSLRKHKVKSSFTFVQIDRSANKYNDLPYFDRMALNMYYRLKKMGLSDIKAYGLEANQIITEHIPLTIPLTKSKLPGIRPVTFNSNIRPRYELYD